MDIRHLIVFMIYSYLGATLEHINYYIGRICNPDTPYKALANPIITGFPIYGLAAYTIVILNNILTKQFNISNLVIHYVVYASVLTLIEYITGIYVNAGKKSYVNGMINSWDYSNESYNIRGIISLRHFVSWGLLGLIVSYVHPKLILKRIN